MSNLATQDSPGRPYGYMKPDARARGLLGNPAWIWLPMFSFLPGVGMMLVMPLCADWRYFSGIAAIFAGTMLLMVFAVIAYGRRPQGSTAHSIPFVLSAMASLLSALGLVFEVIEIVR